MSVIEKESLCEVLFQRELLLNKLTLTLVNKTYADDFDKHQLHIYLAVSAARDHLRDSNEAIFEFLEHDKLLSKMQFFMVYGLVATLALQADALEALTHALDFMQTAAEGSAIEEVCYKHWLTANYPEYLKLMLEIRSCKHLLFVDGVEEASGNMPTAALSLHAPGTQAIGSKRAQLLANFAIPEVIDAWLTHSNQMLNDMVEFFEKIKFGTEK